MEKGIVTPKDFANQGYVLLPNLVSEAMVAFLYEYVLKSAKAGRLRSGDAGVPDSPNFYSDPFMDTLLELLLPRMEKECGGLLFPTYSYFRVYKHGDVLKKHTDRPSCEVSATLNLGYAAQEPWPIWIETANSTKSFPLKPGDALLYKGIELPHWREKFLGEHSAQVFLHYVRQDGPNKDLIYDKRNSLTTSPMISRLMVQIGVS